MREFNIKSLPDKNLIKEMSSEFGVGQVVTALLLQRGINTKFDADEYLSATRNYMHDPFLMKDMEKAVKLLADARENNKRVWVFGDSDVDGISALAIVCSSLKQLGFRVNRYLPDRLRDFYDLKPYQVDEMAEKGCDLLITADCGSNAVEAVERAKALGINVIVTDHHIVANPAPAHALVNPMQEDCEYPFKFLSGTAVAYKLIMAYTLKYSLDPWGFTDSVMDLLAFATVADFMPLVGENRVLVKCGLKAMENTEKPGLAALLREAYLFKDITPKSLQFKVIPKLNSAGRMGRTEDAYQLIALGMEKRTDIKDVTESANAMLEEIDIINRERLALEDEMAKEADSKIICDGLDKDKIIVVFNPEWCHAMCGNLSAKLCRKYRRPVISVGTIEKDGTVYAKGSGRNTDDSINLFETVSGGEEFLHVFGGHKAAVGVTLFPENVDDFRKKINENIVLNNETEEKSEAYDINLKISSVNLSLCADVEKMGPFGEKNPEPVFVSKNLEIKQICAMGKEKQHTKMVFETVPGEFVEAVKWNWTCDDLEAGTLVDIAYTLDVNEFNFRKTPQLMLRDIIVHEDW